MRIPALMLLVVVCCFTAFAQGQQPCAQTDPLGNPLATPSACKPEPIAQTRPVPAAHEMPEIDVFGGYSYVNADVNDLGPRQSANGWEAGVSGNVYKWLSAEAAFNGYYKTIETVPFRDFEFAAGPRINFGPAFVHTLVGVDHLSLDVLGFSISQNSFAAALGGGVQIPVAPRWAIRANVDYVLTQHSLSAILGGGNYTQNNFRVSAGVVFRWGGGAGATGR